MKSEAELRKQQIIDHLIQVQAQKAIKTSLTYIAADGEILRIPPPSPKGFTGEGNRLSDYPFANAQERDSERKKAMETAQARLKAGLAPLEDDGNIENINRLPWAKKDEEPSSSPSSGAQGPDVDVTPKRVPTFLSRSTALKKVQEARAKYKEKVERAIKNYRSEQLNLVRELERLWAWINEAVSEPKELEHRVSQIARIQELLDEIEDAHVKYIEKLFGDLRTRMAQVKLLYEKDHALFKSEKNWESGYKEALESFDFLQKDSASHTVDNLLDYFKKWGNSGSGAEARTERSHHHGP